MVLAAFVLAVAWASFMTGVLAGMVYQMHRDAPDEPAPADRVGFATIPEPDLDD